MALTDKLKAIADAIRAKTGKTDSLTLDQMVTEIAGITTGSDDIPFDLSGTNPKLVSEYQEIYTLDDTTFEKGVSESTASTVIKPTISNKYTNTSGSPTYAYGDDDIIIVQTLVCKSIHDESAVKKAMTIGYVHYYVTTFSKRKTSETSAKTTRQAVTQQLGMSKYYNTSGVLSRNATAYGLYGSCQAASVASATAKSTYVRVTSPSLAYRVNSSYESSANIKLITDCIWVWNVKVYTVDPFTTVPSAIYDRQDQLLLEI